MISEDKKVNVVLGNNKWLKTMMGQGQPASDSTD